MVSPCRSALALGLAAVLSLGLLACGGDDDGGTTGSSTEGGGSTFDGSWTGRTSQGKDFSFTVRSGAVTELLVPYEYGGADCGLVGNSIRGTLKTPVPVTNRRFSVSAFGGESVFEGMFNSPTEASGKGHFEPPAQNRPGCETAELTWDATPVGGER